MEERNYERDMSEEKNSVCENFNRVEVEIKNLSDFISDCKLVDPDESAEDYNDFLDMYSKILDDLYFAKKNAIRMFHKIID